jgi:hypothetical protein
MPFLDGGLSLQVPEKSQIPFFLSPFRDDVLPPRTSKAVSGAICHARDCSLRLVSCCFSWHLIISVVCLRLDAVSTSARAHLAGGNMQDVTVARRDASCKIVTGDASPGAAIAGGG